MTYSKEVARGAPGPQLTEGGSRQQAPSSPKLGLPEARAGMHPSTPPGLGEVQLLTSQTNQIEETLLCKWIHSVIHAQLSEKTFCALRLFGVMSPTVHSFKSLKTSPEEQTATEMTALTVSLCAALLQVRAAGVRHVNSFVLRQSCG